MKTAEKDVRTLDGIELRAAAPDSKGPGTLTGYAARWDSPSQPIFGQFVERFAAGAFARSLGTADVLACSDHEEGAITGRTAAGTLKLSEDELGLRFENELPDTTLGRDLATLVARGDIRGLSFAFVAVVDEWDLRGDMPVRTVRDADLYHISYQTRPAYPSTSVALRSLELARAEAIPPAPEPTPAPAPAADPDPTPASPSLPLLLARLCAAEAF